METIKNMLEIDWSALLLTVVTVIAGLKAISSSFEWIIDKLGLETKWMREKRERSELLNQTAQNFILLQERQNIEEKRSIDYDEKLEANLNKFMEEVKIIVNETNEKMNMFTQNRINDREQSFKIQKQLTESQKQLTESQNCISESVESIIKKIDKMKEETDKRFKETEEKQNERTRADLKNKISESYRYYHAKGEINDMELEALEGLIRAYEQLPNGNNSFVHSIVQQDMYRWKRVKN